MKLHQSGNKIIVTELNPMSDAPRDDTLIMVVTFENFVWPARYRKLLNVDCWYMHIIANTFTEDRLKGWLPMPVYEPSAKSPAGRYEKLRKLNPAQFSELHERNLRGENFDAMVDAL